MSTIYDKQGLTASAADVLGYITEVERIRDGSSEASKERRTYVNAYIRRTDHQARPAAPATITHQAPAEAFVITPDGHLIDVCVPVAEDPPYVDEPALTVGGCSFTDDGFILDNGVPIVTEVPADDVVITDDCPNLGTAAELLKWVGTDPDRAAMMLDLELSGEQRTTVIDRLDWIVNYTSTSTYFQVTATFQTVDEAAAYCREHQMDDARLTRIELTHRQAQDLSIVR